MGCGVRVCTSEEWSVRVCAAGEGVWCRVRVCTEGVGPLSGYVWRESWDVGLVVVK